MTTRKNKKISSSYSKIINSLKREGKFNPLWEIQAWHAAVLKVMCEDMASGLLDSGEGYIETSITREGNERTKQNPAYQLFLQYMDRLQDSIKALGMNTDSKPVKKEERGIGEFLEQFNDD